jgi:adenylate cyclase class IV
MDMKRAREMHMLAHQAVLKILTEKTVPEWIEKEIVSEAEKGFLECEISISLDAETIIILRELGYKLSEKTGARTIVSWEMNG